MDLLLNNKGSYQSFQLLPTVTRKTENHNMERLKVKNFESCRLCLAEIRDSNITLLDGIIKDMLEIILPELNMSICEAPAICKTCLETLKQSYNFKSSCLEVEDKVQDFVNPKTPGCIDLKQVLKKHNNIFKISGNHVICRTCLGLGEENTSTKLCSYDGDPLKNMVEKCLPELGVDLTKEPIICPVCLEQLEEQFHFIMQCLDTEEKINYYCERKNTFKQIDLHSVHVFSMTEDNEDIEKQYGAMENGPSRTCTTVTIEDNSNGNNVSRQVSQEKIKNYGDSIPLVDLTDDVFDGSIKKDKINNDFSGEREPSLPQKNIDIHFFGSRHVPQIEPPPPTEEVTFEIRKDGDGEDIITSTTTRIRNDDEDSDVSITSEDALLTTRFVEKISSDLKNRKPDINDKRSNNVRKRKIEYRDDEDDGGEASDDSSRPKKRLLTRKCKFCIFKTKFTSRMKAHMTVNHSGKSKEKDKDGNSPKKVNNSSKSESDSNPKMKCKKCLYKTTDPEEYRKHKQSHLNEKESKHLENHVFRSPRKANQKPSSPTSPPKSPKKSHSRVDTVKQATKKPAFNFKGQFLKMFKCQICPYQTRMRSNLVKHSLTHKNSTEIINHKCKLCNFNTIHKESFLSHMQSHNNDAENQVKKCFLCSFQPKTEEALKQHVNVVHKSGTG